jgi:hypothetical protein
MLDLFDPGLAKAVPRSGTLMKPVKKTAWIVARDEVFWPTLSLEQGPVLTNLDLGLGSRMEDTPAFRDRFQVK